MTCPTSAHPHTAAHPDGPPAWSSLNATRTRIGPGPEGGQEIGVTGSGTPSRPLRAATVTGDAGPAAPPIPR